MKLRLLLCTVVVLAVSACGRASASSFDPTNPLHCAMQFESYSILAKTQGKVDEAGHYGARASWYVERNRTLFGQQIRDPHAMEKLGDEIVSQADGGLALATECMKRQDADPDWQRLKRVAAEAITQGHDPSTPMRSVAPQ